METTVAVKIKITDSDFCYDCPALTNIESTFPSIYDYIYCRAFDQRLLAVDGLPEKGKWTAERCKDCIEYERNIKKKNMEKMYGIEKMEGYRGVCEYRFYSLYNGTRGVWHNNREKAVQDGQAHQRIVLALLHDAGVTLYK